MNRGLHAVDHAAVGLALVAAGTRLPERRAWWWLAAAGAFCWKTHHYHRCLSTAPPPQPHITPGGARWTLPTTLI